MRLLFLALTTLFGFFVPFMTYILVTKYKLSSFIIWLFVFLPFVIFLKKYLNLRKKDALLEAETTLSQQQELNAYIEGNRDALSKYSNDIDEILIGRYHFKAAYRPRFVHNTQYNSTFCELLFFKEGLTPQQAAKIIFDEVVAQGNEYDPHIFQEKFVKGKLGKFSKFNKIFFGSYPPTPKKILITFFVFGILGLTMYGIPHAFSGPNSNVFIPSKTISDFLEPLNYALTAIISLYLLSSKKYRDSLIAQNGKWTLPFFFIFLPGIVWMFLIAALELGTPKLLNKIAGKEKPALYAVIKDLDTDKPVGRHGHATAYCVKILSSTASKLEDKYCIKKEHYDAIPQDTPVIMKFHGTDSFFGFEIDGYYPGFVKPSDITSFLSFYQNIQSKKHIKNNPSDGEGLD